MMGSIGAFLNLDLLSVGVIVAAIGITGATVYFQEPKSTTHRAFLAFSLATLLWGIINYLAYQPELAHMTLWLFRLVLFFAVWQAFSLFYFFYVFPSPSAYIPDSISHILLPIVAGTAVLTLTPLILTGVRSAVAGEVATLDIGPSMIVFGVVSVGLVLGGFIVLWKKIHGARTLIEKKQIEAVFIGTLASFALIITFNFVLPAFFATPRFIPFGAVFVFPLIATTAYAMFRHKLFDIKIFGVVTLLFALTIAVFLEVIFSNNLQILIFRSGVFLLILSVGILLIRGILQEIEIRERMEQLAKDLAHANERLRELDQQKSEFLSIASHQLRSPLTAIKGYSSMLLEGSFGKITSKKISEAIDRIFESSQRLVVIVNDLLNVSRIEQGRMKYDFTTFDLKKTVADMVEEMTQVAERKKLMLSFVPPGEDITITADAGKITQVISNLIDNAIKYTPKGSVSVALQKNKSGKILISVKDTGVGIPEEEREKLFKKFSRTKDAAKTSSTGTGLGLYVVAEIAKAHHGRAWAESEGAGKGATFYVELPESVTKAL